MWLTLVSFVLFLLIVTAGKIIVPYIRHKRFFASLGLSYSGLIRAFGVFTVCSMLLSLGACMPTDKTENAVAVESTSTESTPSEESSTVDDASSSSEEQMPTDDSINAPTPEASVPSTETPSAPVVDSTQGKYVDGTYTGIGEGFKGNMTVEITVASGKITKVDVTNHQDDMKWFQRAYSGISQAIIANQTPEVDTVSGATFSSEGIIAGAKDALKDALTP